MTLIRYSTYVWKNTTFSIALLIVGVLHSAVTYGQETQKETLVIAN